MATIEVVERVQRGNLRILAQHRAADQLEAAILRSHVLSDRDGIAARPAPEADIGQFSRLWPTAQPRAANVQISYPLASDYHRCTV